MRGVCGEAWEHRDRGLDASQSAVDHPRQVAQLVVRILDGQTLREVVGADHLSTTRHRFYRLQRPPRAASQ